MASINSNAIISQDFNELASRGQWVQAEPPLSWYAVRVRSNHERTAAQHLRMRGFEEFSPCYQSESRWSDRTKKVDRSLFPGYVFCRLDPGNRLPVLTVPGVVGLVGFGKVPAPISEHELENVRRLVGAGLLVAHHPYLAVGQTVVLERGPLTGLAGIVREIKGKLRVVVSVALLQRSVCAEIDRSWVTPKGDAYSYSRLTNGAWVQRRALS